MTIRAINLVLFGILALIGVALATLVAKGSLDRYRAIDEASDINGFAGRVSGIMAALAVERGTTNTVLGDIDASTPDQLDTIKNRRLFADGGLDALVEEVSRHSHISGLHPAGAGIEKALAHLAETRAAVAAMRARFDRVVAGGPEDKALGTEWFKTITGMVFAVDGLRAALERHLEAEVPEAIVRAFMVRARLIELAEFAGQERGFMGGAIASEKRLRAYEIEFVAKARGRIEGAWAVITGHDGDLGPAYEAARAEAELRFFQEFGTLRQEVFDAAVLGRLYPVTAREWFKRATVAMATVLTAQAAAEQAIGAAVEAQRRTALTEVVAAGAGVAVALVVTLVAFLILRARVVRPLKTLAERMLALARGDTGVSLPAVTRTDEVGVMYSALLIFHQAMEERQRFTEERERFQVEQQDVLRRTLREMTDAVEDDLAAAVRHVVELSTTMKQAAVEVATVVAAIRDEATTVASVADQANASAAGVASTSEEVAATGREIARQASQSSQVARGGVAKAQDAVSAVKGLREATNRIGAVAKVIAGIAGRTNLLALNATIEAARAGAAGKGFAVVATEVKALSNQTSRATGEIDQQVRDVQVAVDKSAHAIDDVIGVIADIDQMATTVAAAIEQQEAANLEMSRTAGEVAQGSHQLAESVVDISTRTDHAAALARTVERQARITNSAVTKLGSRLVMVMRQSVAGDRRDSQRVPVTLPLTARWDGRQATGTTVDISDSGMLMRIEPGVEFRVQQTLSVEIERVGTIACVVIGASQRGMHVTFTSVEPAAQQRLKQVIADTLAQDQPYIKAAQDTAARITDAINMAVERHLINIEDMFARDYDPIDGTNPQQYMARFTKIADEIFPPVQEPVLTALPRVLFCIASDRNGYIAAHNAKYALPQRPNDPAWNAANCRNRRLFDDYSGLLASRSTAPFMLQAYDRDMGGGRRELIKEADAPITLNGQHWGAVRIGFGVQ